MLSNFFSLLELISQVQLYASKTRTTTKADEK